jgi:hypothetical protein
MLFMGERISPPLIERAWQDLRQADVLTSGFAAIPPGHAPIH